MPAKLYTRPVVSGTPCILTDKLAIAVQHTMNEITFNPTPWCRSLDAIRRASYGFAIIDVAPLKPLDRP